ncbi:hypothetical protein QVD17_09775 [Tagetes erecta]|uniref:Uncharacterized protein n=1 Tax=Tagetes erecta TaxID=13708 RepID=A0AAD8P499_TARER|nr:hypothetical protein QVD17_09775 [Tagetes erecta]
MHVNPLKPEASLQLPKPEDLLNQTSVMALHITLHAFPKRTTARSNYFTTINIVHVLTLPNFLILISKEPVP